MMNNTVFQQENKLYNMEQNNKCVQQKQALIFHTTQHTS